MSVIFERITIAGVGLIGGSLGMAAREAKLAGTVVGLVRRDETIRRYGQSGGAGAAGCSGIRGILGSTDTL